ncbi:MAG: hypothetical protein IPG85_09795 [Bacteroidetes bacterium]|nr:hypothetical protein [Bacteroidota bacterium]
MTQENLKHLFGAYPNQAEFFETADGTTFLSKQTAEAYAEERLEDKHVKTLTRDDIEEDVKPRKKQQKERLKQKLRRQLKLLILLLKTTWITTLIWQMQV